MKKLLIIVLGIALQANATVTVNVTPISQFPNTNTPGTNWLWLLTKPGVTNYQMNTLQLLAWLNSSLNITNAGGGGNGGNSAYATTAGTATNALGYIVISTNNYSTASLQAALNTNGLISLLPQDYYLTNFVIPDGGFIKGNGARLHQIGRQDFFITSTNNGSLGIRDVIICGDTITNWQDSPQYNDVAFVIPPTSTINPFTPFGPTTGPQWFSNRCGLLINAGGVGSYNNITIEGFEGAGLLLENPNVIQNANPLPFHMSGINCFSNYVGATLCPLNNFWNNWNVTAEYCVVSGLTCSFNSVGFMAGAGNHNITGNDFTKNYCGVFFEDESNEGHGLLANNTVNHCVWAIASESLGAGETIQGNIFASSSGFYLDNAHGVDIRNNRFQNQSPFTIEFAKDEEWVPGTTNLVNTISANSYYGTWMAASGNGVIVTNSASNPSPGFFHIDHNYSIDSTNADGTYNTDGTFSSSNPTNFTGTFTGKFAGQFNATNTPSNGNALRYTNGTYYWAP